MTTRSDLFLKQNPPESCSWAGKVTFSFSYPEHGWIQFAVTCTPHLRNLVVRFSYAFNPFYDLSRWLDDIATGNLPSKCYIDEEGLYKTFRATPVDEDEFLFEIVERWWKEQKLEEEPVYLYVQVNRRQFLSEFLKRWDDFLENQYEPVHWELHGTPSLRALDVSKVREFVESGK